MIAPCRAEPGKRTRTGKDFDFAAITWGKTVFLGAVLPLAAHGDVLDILRVIVRHRFCPRTSLDQFVFLPAAEGPLLKFTEPAGAVREPHPPGHVSGKGRVRMSQQDAFDRRNGL